uniref:Uncharacterized protein n=1 Tax=Plectus sambesii TaxID=2011161 RepID=A0A914WA10_9BILA
MKLLIPLLAFLPLAVVCLPFVDFINPDIFSRNIHQKNPVFNREVGQVLKDNTPGCNWGTFQLCLADFITKSGLSAYDTSNATMMKMAVNQLLADGAKNGPTGAANSLIQLCRAQQVLYNQCLGLDQATQCISAIEFIRQGNTSNDGFGYQMLFTRLNFQCGVAFTSFIAHPMEVAQTPATQSGPLDTCLDNFIDGNLNNDTVTEFCGPMEQYGECVGKIYTGVAQGSVDLGWSVCEATRLANIITLPECTDSQWACKLANLQ